MWRDTGLSALSRSNALRYSSFAPSSCARSASYASDPTPLPVPRPERLELDLEVGISPLSTSDTLCRSISPFSLAKQVKVFEIDNRGAIVYTFVLYCTSVLYCTRIHITDIQYKEYEYIYSLYSTNAWAGALEFCSELLRVSVTCAQKEAVALYAVELLPGARVVALENVERLLLSDRQAFN